MDFFLGMLIGWLSGGLFAAALMVLLAGCSRRRRMYRCHTPSDN